MSGIRKASIVELPMKLFQTSLLLVFVSQKDLSCYKYNLDFSRNLISGIFYVTHSHIVRDILIIIIFYACINFVFSQYRITWTTTMYTIYIERTRKMVLWEKAKLVQLTGRLLFVYYDTVLKLLKFLFIIIDIKV